MEFKKTKLSGAFFIELDKIEDERGFFVNAWDKKKFVEKNLDVNLIESNIAFNKKKGTVRGFHYQIKPFEGTKLIRCTRGKVLDFTLDLRSDSDTFKQWISIELSADNYMMNYIPKGCAHGYQTLEDNSEVLYLMAQEYNLNSERGVRYSDPSFEIKLPLEISKISEKDSSWKDFDVKKES